MGKYPVIFLTLKNAEGLNFETFIAKLWVSKESIFTGLNNFKILSITNTRFDEQFDFTDEEVKELLAYYHVDRLKDDPDARPEAYWINTSGNDLVKRFVDKAGKTTGNDILLYGIAFCKKRCKVTAERLSEELFA